MLFTKSVCGVFGKGLLAMWLWGAIAVGETMAEVPNAEVMAVIERAQQSLNKATELGHAWSVTPTLIDAAEAELAARRPDAALVAAQRALVTANAAIAQAKSEQSAWQARVPSQQP